jgi:hypothetical protein
MFESTFNPLGTAARRLPKNPLTRGALLGDMTQTLGQRSMEVFHPGGQAQTPAVVPPPSSGPTMMQYGAAVAIGIGGGLAVAYFMKPKGKKRRRNKKK